MKLLTDVTKAHKVLPDMKQKINAAVYATESNEKARFPLSPSQATKPLRDLYYGLTNYYKPGTIPQDPMDARVYLIFKHGYLIENMMRDYVAKAYPLKFEQQRVVIANFNDKEQLAGNIDWAIDVNGETVLMDSKSSGAFPFKLAPKEDNVAQMQLYMHSVWGRTNNVNRAILLYYNKDTSDIKCIEVQYDDKLACALVERLKSVFLSFEKAQLPGREYVLGADWQANYSSYRTYDNQEFIVSVKDRAKTTGPYLPLKEFVLAYGNKVVDCGTGSWYIKLTNGKLTPTEVGDDNWETT